MWESQGSVNILKVVMDSRWISQTKKISLAADWCSICFKATNWNFLNLPLTSSPLERIFPRVFRSTFFFPQKKIPEKTVLGKPPRPTGQCSQRHPNEFLHRGPTYQVGFGKSIPLFRDQTSMMDPWALRIRIWDIFTFGGSGVSIGRGQDGRRKKGDWWFLPTSTLKGPGCQFFTLRDRI